MKLLVILFLCGFPSKFVEAKKSAHSYGEEVYWQPQKRSFEQAGDKSREVMLSAASPYAEEVYHQYLKKPFGQAGYKGADSIFSAAPSHAEETYWQAKKKSVGQVEKNKNGGVLSNQHGKPIANITRAPPVTVEYDVTANDLTTEQGIFKGFLNKVSNLFSRDANGRKAFNAGNKAATQSKGNYILNNELQPGSHRLNALEMSGGREDQTLSPHDEEAAYFQPQEKFFGQSEDKKGNGVLSGHTKIAEKEPKQFFVKEMDSGRGFNVRDDERIVDKLSDTFVNAMGKVAKVLMPETTTIWIDRRMESDKYGIQMKDDSNQQQTVDESKQNEKSVLLDKQNEWHGLQVTPKPMAEKKGPISDSEPQQHQQEHFQELNTVVGNQESVLKEHEKYPNTDQNYLPAKIENVNTSRLYQPFSNEKYPIKPYFQQKRGGGGLMMDEYEDTLNYKDAEDGGKTDYNYPGFQNRFKLRRKADEIYQQPDAGVRWQMRLAEAPKKNGKIIEDDDEVSDEGQNVKQQLVKVVKIGPDGTSVHQERVRKVMKEALVSEVEDEKLPPGAKIDENNLQQLVPLAGGKMESGTDIAEPLITPVIIAEPLITPVIIAEPLITPVIIAEPLITPVPAEEPKLGNQETTTFPVEALHSEPLNLTPAYHAENTQNVAMTTEHIGNESFIQTTTEIQQNVVPLGQSGSTAAEAETSRESNANNGVTNLYDTEHPVSEVPLQPSENEASAIQTVKELLSHLGSATKLDLLAPIKYNFGTGSVNMKIKNSALHISFVLPLSPQDHGPGS